MGGNTTTNDKQKQKKRQDLELGLKVPSKSARGALKKRQPKVKNVSGSLSHVIAKGREGMLLPIYEEFGSRFKEHQITPLDINQVACDPTTSFYGRLDKHGAGCYYNSATTKPSVVVAAAE